jgi:hypothetical protein
MISGKQDLPTDSPRRDEVDRVARVFMENDCVGVDFSDTERQLIFKDKVRVRLL